MQDLRRTKEWANWLTKIGWIVEKSAFIRKLPLLPVSFLKIQRFETVNWEKLEKLKKKYRVIWSVLEPTNEDCVEDLEKHGYRKMGSTYLPSKTRVIDLTKSETVLFSDMSENFRRIVRKLEKSKTQRFKTISAEEFFDGWKKWTKSMTLTRYQFDKLVEAFGEKTKLLAIKDDGEIMSAVMLLFSADTCFYYQTWTSDKGRKNSEHVVLVWETIKMAKKMGNNSYDFDGIFDSRFPMAKWGGFSEFKRRFGGNEVVYPGSFSRWF